MKLNGLFSVVSNNYIYRENWTEIVFKVLFLFHLTCMKV